MKPNSVTYVFSHWTGKVAPAGAQNIDAQHEINRKQFVVSHLQSTVGDGTSQHLYAAG